MPIWSHYHKISIYLGFEPALVILNFNVPFSEKGQEENESEAKVNRKSIKSQSKRHSKLSNVDKNIVKKAKNYFF